MKLRQRLKASAELSRWSKPRSMQVVAVKEPLSNIRDQHGVQLVKSAEEARQVAERLLGNHLVTIQTGPEGKKVNQVLVEAGCDIDRELYLGIVLDRAASMPVLMCSQEGGVEIEKVAAETPEKIFKEHFDPAQGIESYQVRKLCQQLEITGKSVRAADKFFKSLCRLYADLDCSLMEINPLVISKTGELVALDSKINFDENAMFRHKDLAELRDLSEEEESEVRAADAGLSYVQIGRQHWMFGQRCGSGHEHHGHHQALWW